MPGRWQWPLGTLGDRDPIVLAEHINSARRGVDLGYEPRPYDWALDAPVFAVHGGEVMFCGETTNGFAISIRHVGTEWATFYAHLSAVSVDETETQRCPAREGVRAGDVIGYAAKAPIHIRFELVRWTPETGFVAIDPKPEMARWADPSLHGSNPIRKAA
jgi:hypothetical protein